MQIEIREDRAMWGSESQRDILLRFIRAFPLADKFFLTGGTALGVFYIHHRTSNDLVLFTIEGIDLIRYSAILRDIIRPSQIISERSSTFLSYISKEGVKIDLVVDHLSTKGVRPKIQLEEHSFLPIDLIENIIINKICAVISRGEPKDIIDLFFLLKDRGSPFQKFFQGASEREALLEDHLYVISAFEKIYEDTEGIILDMEDSLKKAVNLSEFRNLWLNLKSKVEKRIGRC